MKIKLGMNNVAHKLVTEVMPALSAIFELGFIPDEDEIVQLSKEVCDEFERRMGKVKDRPLYTVMPKDLKNRDDKNISVMSEAEADYLRDAIKFLTKYARDNNLPAHDSERILKHAANAWPNELSEGTRFEPPKLRVLNPTAEENVPDNAWLDFMLSAVHEDDVLAFQTTDETGLMRNTVLSPKAEKQFGGNKMTYREFKTYAMESLAKIFGDGVEVVENISQRADDLAREVIHIKQKWGEGVLHNGFTIDPFYNEYALGKPLGELILEMVKTVEGADEWIKKVDLSSIHDFDKVKDRLIIRPLNYARNKNTLKNFMYRPEGDIAIVIYLVVNQDNGVLSTTKIERKTIEGWNLSEEYVFWWAAENTAKLYKPCVIPLDAFMAGSTVEDYPAANKYFMEERFTLKKSRFGCYSLALENNVNAATVPFIPGALEKLADAAGDNLYLVLPDMSIAFVHTASSISLKEVKRKAREEKNSLYADAQEFLSDNVYFYSRADGSFTML